MAKKFCVVGYYFAPHDILEAARKVKARNFAHWDTFTPFAVHGMDEAMGLKRTALPYVSFLAGTIGLFTAIGLEVWTHLYSWPHNIGGKPLLAIPAYVPIFFELTVLFCGVISTAVMFTVFLGLPNYRKPIFHPDITNDRFAVAVEVSRSEEIEPVKKFLREIQAQDIQSVEGAL